jgi:hypothetical protein
MPTQKTLTTFSKRGEEVIQFVRARNAKVGIFSWLDDQEWIVVNV